MNRMKMKGEIRDKSINYSNRMMIRKNKYFMVRMMNRKKMDQIPKIIFRIEWTEMIKDSIILRVLLLHQVFKISLKKSKILIILKINILNLCIYYSIKNKARLEWIIIIRILNFFKNSIKNSWSYLIVIKNRQISNV